MSNSKIIKQTVIDLLNKINFKAQVEINDSDQDNIVVNIQTEEGGFLIGQSGSNLNALQHITRILVNKKNDQPTHFILDVNDYRKHRLDLLRDLAQNMAQQALLKKVSLILHPMPAYERRIIHLALADHPKIDTESTGEGLQRRIVIKPTKACS